MTTRMCLAAIAAMLLWIAGTNQTAAQLQRGMVELSCAGMFESRSQSVDGGTAPESIDYFALSVAPGYYLTSKISIEPELHMLLIKNELPSYVVSANICATPFENPGKMAMFLKAGYGIGNSLTLVGIPLRQSARFDIPVLNLGTGLKFFVSDRAALRLEYRYQRYSYSSTFYSYYGPGQSRTVITNFSQILIGLSVFLPSAQ